MWQRAFSRVAITVLTLVALSYIVAYAIWWNRIQSAKAFIEQLQRLEVGKTPESQIKELIAQHGGKYVTHSGENVIQGGRVTQAAASYDVVSYAPPYLFVGGSPRTLPGLRRWGLVASLEVNHGYLSTLYLSVGVFRSDGFELTSTVRLTGAYRFAAPEEVPYYVYEPHITGPPGEALGAELSPAASAEDRRKGFDFNLACLTTFRGCRHVCDTFPSVWNDLSPRNRLTYQDGTPVNDYRKCRNSMR